jgi:hypothetical protein
VEYWKASVYRCILPDTIEGQVMAAGLHHWLITKGRMMDDTKGILLLFQTDQLIQVCTK